MLTDIEKPKKYKHKPAFTEKELIQITSLPQLFMFTIKDFIQWWYIQMPILFINTLGRFLQVMNDQLSITLLLKNFFTSWKKDKTAIGYFMGITIKLLYMPVAVIIMLGAIGLAIILTILWLIIPLVTIFFILFTPILPI